MEFRELKTSERHLLLELAKLAGLENPESWVSTLRVRDMNDGGMGSLEFSGSRDGVRSGLVIPRASVRFVDEDGVDVIVTLNAGEDGYPFEMDVWKTDFSPLKRIPETFVRVD